MFDYTATEKWLIPVVFVAEVVVALLLRWALSNKSAKTKRIPFIVIAVAVVLLEIGKQIYYCCTGYITYALPLHFCSLFIVLFPLSAFGGRVSKVTTPLAFAYSSIVLILNIVCPHALMSTALNTPFASYFHFHTVFYHQLVALWCILTIVMGEYKPKVVHALWSAVGVVFYAIYAIPAAYALKANYVNILYNTEIAFLEALRLNYGQVVYLIVWFVLGCLAVMLPIIIYWAITKIGRKPKEVKE